MKPLDFIQYLCNEDECNVVLIGNGCGLQIFNTVMTFCKTLSLQPAVHMFPNSRSTIDLSFFLRGNMKKLHVINREYCCVTCVGNIPQCSHLTELHLIRIQSADHGNGIDILATHGLCSALKDGKLPELTHLNFFITVNFLKSVPMTCFHTLDPSAVLCFCANVNGPLSLT